MSRKKTKKKIKSLLVCSTCGSENVQSKYWVNCNTLEVIDSAGIDEQDNWCCNCSSHCKLKLKS